VPTRQSTYHHGDLRRAILDEAVALLESDGPAALSLREVARRLGVSHNAPSRHFPDRAALIDAISADGFVALTSKLAAVRGASPTARLAALGQAYVAFADAHPALFALMFTPGDPSALTLTQPVAADALAQLSDAVRDVTGDDDPVDVAAMWAVVHGLAQLRLNGLALFGRPSLVAEITRRQATALERRTRPRLPG
jgi:AcrR family transcriptional regulator